MGHGRSRPKGDKQSGGIQPNWVIMKFYDDDHNLKTSPDDGREGLVCLEGS